MTTMTMKTEKEQAFLYDLYVTPDWSERFAQLVDEHVTLPKEGRALYVSSGTGSHALALAVRAEAGVEIVGIDADQERTALAQAKQTVAGADVGVEFRTAQLEALPFEDDSFDLVLGDASLLSADRLPELLAEMTRVAALGATVALACVTASSFGELFSLYWEALASVTDGTHAAIVETLIHELPTVSNLETMARSEGLDEVQSWTTREEFEYANGEEFFTAPLVSDFLLPQWFASLPEDDTRDAVRGELRRLIDEDRDEETKWAFSIKATVVAGQRGT